MPVVTTMKIEVKVFHVVGGYIVYINPQGMSEVILSSNSDNFQSEEEAMVATERWIERNRLNLWKSTGELPGLPPDSHAATFLYQQDAPSCHECGSIVVRSGSDYKCLNCGTTSGCG